MSDFKGVATRRLDGYLAWFKWWRSFKRERTAEGFAELAVKQLAHGNYETSRRKRKDTPYLFMEYWESAV